MSNNLLQLMSVNESERTPAQRDALALHERLVYDRQMVELGVVSMCRDLKEIRDGKHYVTLGFEDFGEYTEQMHGIGSRQSYKYIRIYEKLGVEFLNSSSKIGVTKLLELASLDNSERQELLAEHSVEELEDMSTAEVKRLTDEVRNLKEQISFFENNEKLNSSSKTDEDTQSELREEIESKLRTEYKVRTTEFERKVMLEKDAAINSLKSELREANANLKMNIKTVKAAEERAIQAEARAKEAEEKAAQVNEFELKFKNAEAEKEAMEKKIKLSSDPELTRFKYLFETWQSSTLAMFEQLAKLDDQTQQKMRAAVKAVIGDRL